MRREERLGMVEDVLREQPGRGRGGRALQQRPPIGDHPSQRPRASVRDSLRQARDRHERHGCMIAAGCGTMPGSMNEPRQPDRLPAVVTVAALYGAGGRAVGPRVAELLGVPFLDRAIPSAVAERAGVSESAVADVDEAPQTRWDRLTRNLGEILAPAERRLGAGGAPGPRGAPDKGRDRGVSRPTRLAQAASSSGAEAPSCSPRYQGRCTCTSAALGTRASSA